MDKALEDLFFQIAEPLGEDEQRSAILSLTLLLEVANRPRDARAYRSFYAQEIPAWLRAASISEEDQRQIARRLRDLVLSDQGARRSLLSPLSRAAPCVALGPLLDLLLDHRDAFTGDEAWQLIAALDEVLAVFDCPDLPGTDRQLADMRATLSDRDPRPALEELAASPVGPVADRARRLQRRVNRFLGNASSRLDEAAPLPSHAELASPVLREIVLRAHEAPDDMRITAIQQIAHLLGANNPVIDPASIDESAPPDRLHSVAVGEPDQATLVSTVHDLILSVESKPVRLALLSALARAAPWIGVERALDLLVNYRDIFRHEELEALLAALDEMLAIVRLHPGHDQSSWVSHVALVIALFEPNATLEELADGRNEPIAKAARSVREKVALAEAMIRPSQKTS